MPIRGFERDGGAIAIGTVGSGARRTLAFIADEDEDAIHTVDLDQRLEIARTEVSGRPTAALILPNGDLAVALRDTATLAILSVIAPNQPLLLRVSIATADEPVALATSPDSKTLWVASGLGRALEAFSLSAYDKRATIDLGREPRALTLSSDGARAFVGYMSESGVGTIDLHTRRATLATLGTPVTTSFETPSFTTKPCALDLDVGGACKSIPQSTRIRTVPGRVARQTFALVRVSGLSGDEAILAPTQLVGPGEPMVISSGYGSSTSESPVMFDLAKLDGRTGIGSVQGITRGAESDCRLPRGAALDTSGHVAVACLGSNALAVYNTTTKTPSFELAYRLGVGGGPTAVAHDPVHNTFVVLTPFSRRAHIVGEKKLIPITLSHDVAKGLTDEAEEGRRLFYNANDTRISGDGRACASCHPDGRDDGLVWPTPKGPRQTVLLAGRLARPAPFGWDGKHESLAAHVKVTMNNLHGSGLPDRAVDQLAAYLVSLPAPPKREHDLGPEELKGQALFASAKTGCAGCHTDSAAYDVASATKADQNKTFLAPNLRFIGASAPYFHDGRYPTLASMLSAKDNAMGSTAELHDDEIRALEAYLLTL